MAKGGGKGKGRPRKPVELIAPPPPIGISVDLGECSTGAGVPSPIFTGTVESVKDKIELEIKASVEKQSEILQEEGKK